MPIVSIIVPVYNKGWAIERCLNSIHSQSEKDWECILVDNNSTDNSRNVCEIYSNKDSRFKIIECREQGVHHARNKALEIIKGEWVSFIDADDYIDEDYYETLLNCICNNPGYKAYACAAITTRPDTLKPQIWNNLEEGVYTRNDKFIFSSRKKWSTVWNGLWSATLFNCKDSLTFKLPLCEDELFCWEYFLRNESFYHTTYAGYHHVITEKGISYKKSYYKDTAFDYIRILTNAIHKYNTFSDEIINVINTDVSRRYNTIFSGIDLVVTYTKNTAEDIKRIIKEHNYDVPNLSDVELNKRYNKEDTIFKLCIRSIAKNLPFIRLVHVVIEDETHVPTWLDSEKVHVVYHKDFIPKEYLPLYNSSSIEVFLPNIPFLGNRFLYANSDYVLLKRKLATNFYTINQIKININRYKRNSEAFIKLCNNTYKSIYSRPVEDIGYIAPTVHVLTPFITRRAKQCYNKYKQTLLNSITKFREDININQYFYVFYEAINYGLAPNEIKSYTYQNVINYKALANSDMICVEDVDDDNKIVKAILNKYPYLNVPCKYEVTKNNV